MNNKEIKIESLVATMGTEPRELAKKMNIQTNAIIINQDNKVSQKDFIFRDNLIRAYDFTERGVGRSRNEALMRASSHVCMMADDDMVYVDDYPEKVLKAYEKYPDADLILFNVRIHMNNTVTEKVKEDTKVNYFNSLKYGTVTFSFRREKILKANIFFSLLFGGGAKHSNGEDSLFLWSCLKSGMKIYAVKDVIADVYNDDSSWFVGHNEKFFIDRGALFAALSPKFSSLLIVQYAIRKHRSYMKEMPFFESIKLMLKGSKNFLRS